MRIARHVKHASLALIALSSVGVLQGAYANGTASGTNITNQATVDYSVGGVNQTTITSPTASFVVDTRIDFNVTELGGTATQTTPGVVNVVTRFQLTNTGNSTQGYVLSVVNEAGTVLFTQTDNQDVSNLRIFVDSNGNGVYDAGADTATNINSLITDADGESLVVFVVADIPVAATNNQYANVRLTARATPVGSTTPLAETSGPDTAGVDVVWADAGRDNSESAADQYHIQSAALTLAKSAAVVWDPFNLGADPKAIPGARVEYTITVTNGSTTTAADAVNVIDNIPANTTFFPGSISLNGGALPDTNFQAAPTPRVVVDAGSVAANNGTATVRFTVTINN
jgi:uncharacterized repeat protein (TIGR01451 family)